MQKPPVSRRKQGVCVQIAQFLIMFCEADIVLDLQQKIAQKNGPASQKEPGPGAHVLSVEQRQEALPQECEIRADVRERVEVGKNVVNVLGNSL